MSLLPNSSVLAEPRRGPAADAARLACASCFDRIPKLKRNCAGFALRAAGIADAPNYVDPDAVLHLYGARLAEIDGPAPGALKLFQSRHHNQIKHASYVRSVAPERLDERPRYLGDVSPDTDIAKVRLSYPREYWIERHYLVKRGGSPISQERLMTAEWAPPLPGWMEARLQKAAAIDRGPYSECSHHGPDTFVFLMTGMIEDESRKVGSNAHRRMCGAASSVHRAIPGDVVRLTSGSNNFLAAFVTHTSPEILLAYRPAFAAPVQTGVRLEKLLAICGSATKANFWRAADTIPRGPGGAAEPAIGGVAALFDHQLGFSARSA